MTLNTNSQINNFNSPNTNSLTKSQNISRALTIGRSTSKLGRRSNKLKSLTGRLIAKQIDGTSQLLLAIFNLNNLGLLLANKNSQPLLCLRVLLHRNNSGALLNPFLSNGLNNSSCPEPLHSNSNSLRGLLLSNNRVSGTPLYNVNRLPNHQYSGLL